MCLLVLLKGKFSRLFLVLVLCRIAGSLYFGPGTLLVLVLWPGTFAAGGILEGYFGDWGGSLIERH